jgi:hypothetical protein
VKKSVCFARWALFRFLPFDTSPASNPAACKAAKSFAAASTSAAIPPAGSYSGDPGRAPRWTMPITGLPSPKTRLKFRIILSAYALSPRFYTSLQADYCGFFDV